MLDESLVGNDVVDLDSPGARNKFRDRRFVQRVFCPEEQALLNRSSNPGLDLWKLWAAKEAAFKVQQKRDPSTIFSPRRFEVSPKANETEGSVLYREKDIPVRWTFGDGWVHALAASGNDFDGLFAEVATGCSPEGRFTPAEGASIHSAESALVRRLAKSILERFGLTGLEIVRDPLKHQRFSPPYVLSLGRRTNVGVSLSHDGRFIAAAVAGLSGSLGGIVADALSG